LKSEEERGRRILDFGLTKHGRKRHGRRGWTVGAREIESSSRKEQ